MSCARRFCALALVLMVGGPACGLVLADGDPASDVLLGQSVFVPYSPMSSTLQRRLFAFTDAGASRPPPARRDHARTARAGGDRVRRRPGGALTAAAVIAKS